MSHIEGDYYDLQLVPERYTGYSGHDARRIWKSIYEENCFGLSESGLLSGKLPLVSAPDTEQCLEKKVYYKLISGMLSFQLAVDIIAQFAQGLHTSISTHICHEYLNQTTGEWVSPNICSRMIRLTIDFDTGTKSELFHISRRSISRAPATPVFQYYRYVARGRSSRTIPRGL